MALASLATMIRLSGLALAASAGLLFFPAWAQAQGRNATLLGAYNPGEYTNDIWGYVDPNTGKEYALLMTRARAIVLDCSNPATPIVRGTFSRSLSGWRASTWRDARTFGHYMYVVTEGGGGMQIIDLSNPDNPTFVRTHTIPGRSWNNTHNISIDTEAGICYAVGTSGGMHVMDLNANPTNPTYLTTYTTEYVHDMQAQDGLAYLAEINRQQFRVVDVSNPSNVVNVGSAFNASCHTAFPNRTGTVAVATTENFGGGMTIYDVSNPASPRQLSTWATGGSVTSVHNAFILDGVIHASYYSEGYRALDISDPSRPVQVAYYDTNASSSGFDGAWGCYPFQPSGVVYMSDQSNGLMVIDPLSRAESYGTAAAGTGGVAPTMHTYGASYLGNANFAVEVADAQPLAPTLFMIGTAQQNLSYGGLTLLVDTTLGVVFPSSTNAAGEARMSISVPNSAGLLGLTLHAQGFVQDAAGPLGYATTDGLRFTTFLP